jgi:hypothetical protein
MTCPYDLSSLNILIILKALKNIAILARGPPTSAICNITPKFAPETQAKSNLFHESIVKYLK